MENPSRLFTLSFILISSYAFLINANESSATLVTKVCNNVKDTTSCLKVLQADPQTLMAKTNCELAKFTIELAMKRALETQIFLKELMKKDNSPYLQSCAFDNYGSVIQDYEMVLSGLTRDVLLLTCDLLNTSDGVEECENQLHSQGIYNPDISSRNKETKLFIDIVYEAVDHLLEICPAN